MPKRYWTIILIYVAAQVLPIFIVELFLGFNMSVIDATVYSLIISMTAASIITIYLLKPDMNQEQFRNRSSSIGTIIKWSIIGFFMAYAAQIIANLINMEVLGIKGSSENTEYIINSIEENMLFILLPIVFAPLLEEIIFRKIIFGQLYKKINFFFAAIISSAIFGALHMEFKFLLTYSVLGLVFAYLYVKTNRIIVPIIAHMCINAYAVLMSLFVDLDKLEQRLKELEQAVILLGG